MSLKPVGRTTKFFYNSLAAAAYQLILMICGFILPKIMLVYYGSETNGLVTSINQFISYLALVEAGLAGAAVFALYKPLADENYEEVCEIVSAAKRFYFQSGYIFTSLVILLAVIYPFFITSISLSYIQIVILVCVLGFRGCLEFFTLAKYRVLLTADQKIYVISIVSSMSMVVSTAIIAALAYFRYNIVIVHSIALAAVMFRPFALWLYVKKYYPFVRYDKKPNYNALNKRWDAFYLQLLQSAQVGTPIILATVFTSLQMVSVYAIFNMVMSGINGILGIFTAGLSSSFGEVIAKKELNILQKTAQEFEFAFYAFITVVYSVSFISIMSFIRLFTAGVTDVNYDLPVFGYLIVLNGYLHHLKTPQGMLVISAGLYKETRIQSTLQALIIVLFGLILAPVWGIYGIIVAVCLSNIFRDIELMFFIPRHVTKLPVWSSMMRILWSVTTLVCINLPFYSHQFQASTFGQWTLNVVFVVIWASFCVIISSFLLQRTQLFAVFNRIKGMIRA